MIVAYLAGLLTIPLLIAAAAMCSLVILPEADDGHGDWLDGADVSHDEGNSHD